MLDRPSKKEKQPLALGRLNMLATVDAVFEWPRELRSKSWNKDPDGKLERSKLNVPRLGKLSEMLGYGRLRFREGSGGALISFIQRTFTFLKGLFLKGSVFFTSQE